MSGLHFPGFVCFVLFLLLKTETFRLDIVAPMESHPSSGLVLLFVLATSSACSRESSPPGSDSDTLMC